MITYLWVCATWLTISKHNRTPPPTHTHLVISYVAILCCTKTSGLVTFSVMLHSGGFHLRLEMSAPGFVCVCFRKPPWERQWLRQHSAVCGKNDRPTLLWRQLASLITNCCDSSLVYKTHPHLSTHCAFINDVTILWCSDRHFCRCRRFALNYMWYDVWLDFTPLSSGVWLLDILFTPVCTIICTNCHS